MANIDSFDFSRISRPVTIGSGLSLVISAGLPPAIFAVLNFSMLAAGFAMPAAAIAAPLGVTGGIAATAWMLALASWGLTRWAVVGRGEAGRIAADWLMVLIAAGIAFPFITLGFDFFFTTLTAFGLAMLALGTIRRVVSASPLAAIAMVPSVVALILPGLVGFAILSMGWTPPFGATQALEAAPASAEDIDV